MIAATYQRSISRLLLTFSDLAETDHEIAKCLVFIRITPLPDASAWTAEVLRRLMPLAYSTVSASSDYATQTNQAPSAYCKTIYKHIKKEK